MELSNHFDAIVEDLVNKIYQQVQERAQQSVDEFLKDKLADIDVGPTIARIVTDQVNARVQGFEFDTKKLNLALADAGTQAVAMLKTTVQEQITNMVVEQFTMVDIKDLVREQISEIIDNRISTAGFPDKSIAHESINFDGLALSGDQIHGGIIKQFGSTGIDDRASKCQLTILDTHVVVEAPILTTGADVRGDAVIDGNVSINGTISKDCTAFKELIADTVSAVQESLNDELFSGFSNHVADNIRARGIDFSEVLINGRLILSETKLGPSVTHSNLTRLGELDELQVKGETFLSRTLYASSKRVGVNTVEPSAALSVWDEEVEILVGKKKAGVGFIGSNRDQTVVLTSNGKENLSLDPDGSVTINDLRLGALPISTASQLPNWAGRAGEIIFNDCPGIGKPIGWVCLDGHRWGQFGIIQE